MATSSEDDRAPAEADHDAIRPLPVVSSGLGDYAVRREVAELIAARGEVSEECLRMLKIIQGRCPGLLPNAPLDPGGVGPEIPLDPKQVLILGTTAARQAAGLASGSDADSVVWRVADNELMVLVSRVRLDVGDGMVTVTVPVHCDQAPEAEVMVPFAVGSDKSPAGLLVATETSPRGPAAIVDLWGEALTAFGWQILVTMVTELARGSGSDTDGAPLIPAGLTGSPEGLRVLTMARHTFDRAVS